jgi:3-dehydroquinate synthetase
LLALLGLPLQTSLAPNAILAAMRGDKKKRGGRLRFVVPRAIGDVEYGVECADRTVRAVLERMQQPPENFRARR